MKPIENFDNVKPAGDIESLPAGGYVCEIKQVKEVQNKNSAGTHLEILFDVCEGDYRGFFGEDWKNQDREDKFWRGIINQNIPDSGSSKYAKQLKFFKRFTNTVEDSNPGYHWDWNEAGLKGKKVGIVFGEREKISKTGNVYIVTDAKEIITVEDARAGKYKIPARKTATTVNATSSFALIGEEDGDLPF